MKTVTHEHIYWNGQPIPSMTYDKLVKYLGVKFNPEGRISVPMEEWKMWLEKIGKSKLKQEQKVEAVRCCIIPKILHTL